MFRSLGEHLKLANRAPHPLPHPNHRHRIAHQTLSPVGHDSLVWVNMAQQALTPGWPTGL